MRVRLDELMTRYNLAQSRSQAANLIRLGKVYSGRQQLLKPGAMVEETTELNLKDTEIYVSRAGFKLASVADKLGLDFRGSVLLDVGSSTGGFTDYALQHGARKVIAVDVGTNQLHESLRNDSRIELYEKTDIRDFASSYRFTHILIDVSFISLKEILPAVAGLAGFDTKVIAMAKPQFETGGLSKNKGVVKNEKIRRNTLKNLEDWIKNLFIIVDKADAEVSGEKGNKERFYLLKILAK